MIVPDICLNLFNNSLPEGHGNLYLGHFANDMYNSEHEIALYLWRDGGDIYTGSFLDGLQHGFGMLINTEEKSRFIGSFKFGYRSGIGFHERNQDFYIG